MGLDLIATGFDGSVRIGYMSFGSYRRAVAKSYNKEFGNIYEKWYKSGLIESFKLTEVECQRWNEISDDDLDILLTHSDCDGQMSVDECKKVYKALSKIDFKPDVNAEFNERLLRYHDNVLGILRHCIKRKVILKFV